MNSETTPNNITQNENKKSMRAIVKTYPKMTGKFDLNCFFFNL
jgi:hypothetical protein